MRKWRIWAARATAATFVLGLLAYAGVSYRVADGLTKPKAFVALRNPPTDPAAMAAELCDFLRERLPAYKVPRWLIPVERLPRTATGKIQRFKLRREH